MQHSSYQLCLRNNVDAVVLMAEAKWYKQLGHMLLCVAAIVILWQVTYEQHLPVLNEMLEKMRTFKAERGDN